MRRRPVDKRSELAFVRGSALLFGACALVFSAPARAAGVTAASYFGGAGADALTGVAIGSDGSVFIAGTSDSTTLGSADAKQLGKGGFVAKLDATGTHLTWLSWIEAPGRLYLSATDEPIVSAGHHLLKVAADGSALVWTGTELPNAITDFNVAPNGDIGVIAGGSAWLFGSDGKTAKITVASVGRDHVSAVAVDPQSGNLFVSGDTNAGYGSCGGPWRSPFIFSYDAQGQRVSKLYDFSGQQACDQSLAADSFFEHLSFDAKGTLWVSGGSDGGNTVLTRSALDLAKNSAALEGACFASPCYGWKGAAKPGFFGVLNADKSDFERASFVIAHFANAPAACSCDVKPDAGGTPRPNSAGLAWLFPTSTGDVVGVGASAWHFPTVNAWYPQAAYTGSPAVVAVLDAKLSTMKLATYLPGSGGPAQAAYRGGKLVVVGKAVDNSAWMPPAGQEMIAQATLPATPSGAALQSAFAGGTSDGYLFVACMTTDAECGAPPAPNPMGTAGSGSATAGNGNSSANAGSSNVGGASTGGPVSSSAGSVTEAAGTSNASAPAADSGNASGCGCKTAGGQTNGSLSMAAALVALALASLRRTRTAQ